jgi:hypothetical protein
MDDIIRTNIGFAILLILISLLVWYIWTSITEVLAKRVEGFTGSGGEPFGNKLLELSVGPTSTDNIIELPGKYKLTGFKFANSTNGTLTPDNKFFKVYIANDKNDIKTADNRQLILNSNGKAEFEVGTDYYDVGLFENGDGTAKYVGGCLMVEKAGLDFPPFGTVEVYGLAPYGLSKADYEKMPSITGTLSGEPNPNKPEVLFDCKSNEKDADYKIGWLDVTVSKPSTSTASTFTDIPRAIEAFQGQSPDRRVVVRYQNTLDGKTNIYPVDGPYQLAFIKSPSRDKLRIYFDEPIVASRIRIEGICEKCIKAPIETNKNPTDGYTLPAIRAYGTLAVARDLVNFKLQRQKFDQRGVVIEGQKCPNVGEMMNKQLQAQLICESLEYKDRERNKKVAYETDKVYLKKLGDQEREIKGLESVIGDLIKRKNIRVSNSSGGTNIDELTAILNKAESARKEAESYMADKAAGRHGVNVKVNLDPQFTGIAARLASRNNPVA